MAQLPDFIIIGAMKSATSTLHEQLARQPGIFMTTPKEPYFFSDDPVYAQGIDWYKNLFSSANATDLKGESTTHYTKLPTYPQTLERIEKHVPDAKFIYVMRHPVERLVSQYIHHWTEREVTVSLDEAVATMPILTAYSQYTMQLTPYFERFGQERVLPVFFDRLRQYPQETLEQVCRFIGYGGTPKWDSDDQTRNVSSQRMQDNWLRDMLVNLPVVTTIRKRLIPQSWRDRVKQQWQMTERPTLSPEVELQLEQLFNVDLALLGEWLGVQLDCENFRDVTSTSALAWKKGAPV